MNDEWWTEKKEMKLKKGKVNNINSRKSQLTFKWLVNNDYRKLLNCLTLNTRASLSYGQGVQSVNATPWPINGPLKTEYSLAKSLTVQIELRLESVDRELVFTPIIFVL